MPRFVVPVLSVVMMLGGSALVSGCHAEARFGEPPATPTPPPPKETALVAAGAVMPTQPPPKIIHFPVKGEHLELPAPVEFKTGSAVLEPQSDAVLQVVADYLKQNPHITLLRIEGHTDNVGSKADNQKLSEQRALAVAHWEVNHGIDCKRLLPVGFGDTKPIDPKADQNSVEQRTLNRRVAAVNAAKDNKPIAGIAVDGGGVSAGDACK